MKPTPDEPSPRAGGAAFSLNGTFIGQIVYFNYTDPESEVEMKVTGRLVSITHGPDGQVIVELVGRWIVWNSSSPTSPFELDQHHWVNTVDEGEE